MRRRDFVCLLGGATSAWPILARAQSNRLRRVGIFIGGAENDPVIQPRLTALKQSLNNLGWIEGQNIELIYRWSTDPDVTRKEAAELVALKPDLIFAHSPVVTLALSKATQSIPIVFVQITDPVGSGLVASLARPGGNVTGFATFEFEMATKWLDMLKEVAPGIVRVGVMQYAKSPTWIGQIRTFESLGHNFGVQVVPAGVETSTEIESAFAAIGQTANGGIVILPDTFTLFHRKLIIGLAAQHRLPAIYPFRYFTEDGGLISYGIDLIDIWRRSGNYINDILRGATAADLPVQQPTKFEMVVNLKTASTLGLTVSPTLLARADKVIE
jgi:ABC-type uncharacterized transport system substrate-binding protein